MFINPKVVPAITLTSMSSMLDMMAWPISTRSGYKYSWEIDHVIVIFVLGRTSTSCIPASTTCFCQTLAANGRMQPAYRRMQPAAACMKPAYGRNAACMQAACRLHTTVCRRLQVAACCMQNAAGCMQPACTPACRDCRLHACVVEQRLYWDYSEDSQDSLAHLRITSFTVTSLCSLDN